MKGPNSGKGDGKQDSWWKKDRSQGDANLRWPGDGSRKTSQRRRV